MLEGNLSAMLASSKKNPSKQERQLLDLFRKLDHQQQQTLTEFAAFLSSREKQSEQAEKQVLAEPEPVERPAEESVVAAMKRLSATYPMIDKAVLLNEASALMAQHMLQGRAAGEVIDELEVLFADAWRTLKEGEEE